MTKMQYLPWQSGGPSIILNEGLVKVVVEEDSCNATINVNGFVILTLLSPQEAVIGLLAYVYDMA